MTTDLHPNSTKIVFHLGLPRIEKCSHIGEKIDSIISLPEWCGREVDHRFDTL